MEGEVYKAKKAVFGYKWQTRHFKLKGTVISYFKDKKGDASKPLGVIDTATVMAFGPGGGKPSDTKELTDKTHFPFFLSVTGGRTYLLGAKTEAERDAWVAAIGKATHNAPSLTRAGTEMEGRADRLTVDSTNSSPHAATGSVSSPTSPLSKNSVADEGDFKVETRPVSHSVNMEFVPGTKSDPRKKVDEVLGEQKKKDFVETKISQGKFSMLHFPPTGILNRDLEKTSLTSGSAPEAMQLGSKRDINTEEAKQVLFQLYAQSYLFKQNFPDIDMPMPKFLFIGSQSAGKSTVSELLAGFPINVCKNEVGTRRPLSVILEYDGSLPSGQAVCTIEGQPIKQELVSTRVEQINAELGPKSSDPNDEGTFSNQYIHLNIRSKDVLNMVFVDPPGLRVDGSTAQNMIEEILEKELQDPDNIVVAVLNTGDYGNQRALSFLTEVKGQQWLQTPGNCIFLMPHFDSVTRMCQHGHSANDRLETFTRPWLKPIHLILWAYDVGHNASFARKQKHLQDIPPNEKKIIQEWLHTMAKNNTSDPGSHFDETRFLPRIGWDKALAVFQQSLGHTIKTTLPGNLQKLYALRDSNNDKIVKFKAMMKDSDPMKLRNNLSAYVVHLCKEIRACMDGDVKAANLLSLTTIGQTVADEGNKFTADDTFQGITFKGIERSHLKMFMKQVENMEKLFQGPHQFREDDATQLNPDLRLYGGKQYQRMKFYFWRALDSAVDLHLTDDEIKNVCGFLGADHTSQDIDAAAVRLIKFCMERSIHPGISYLMRRTGYILFRLVNVAIWTLAVDADWKPVTDRFVSGSFYERLITASLGFLKDNIHYAADHCREAAEASYGTVGTELKGFSLVQDLVSLPQYNKKPEKGSSADSGGSNSEILDDKRDPNRELRQVVRTQVTALMCLNKINLNNSLNSLLFLKFRDDLQDHLLAIVNKLTDDEIVSLFGAGGSQVEKELQSLERKKSALDDIIGKYVTFQDFVNSL